MAAIKKPLTITLELPPVTYPRKVLFPEGAHSIVLVYTKAGSLWTLLEDKQIPYLDEAALASAFGLTKTAYLRSEIYAPDYFGIPIALCYDYIRLQMRLDMLYENKALVYRHLNRLALLHCQIAAVRDEMSRHIAAKLATL